MINNNQQHYIVSLIHLNLLLFMSKNADEIPLQTCYTNTVEKVKIIYKTK